MPTFNPSGRVPLPFFTPDEQGIRYGNDPAPNPAAAIAADISRPLSPSAQQAMAVPMAPPIAAPSFPPPGSGTIPTSLSGGLESFSSYEDPYAGWKGGNPVVDEAARFGIESRARLRRLRVGADEAEEQERQARDAKHALEMENARIVYPTDQPAFYQNEEGAYVNTPRIGYSQGELKAAEAARAQQQGAIAKERAAEEVKAGAHAQEVEAAMQEIDRQANLLLGQIDPTLSKEEWAAKAAEIKNAAAQAKITMRAHLGARQVVPTAVSGYENPLATLTATLTKNTVPYPNAPKPRPTGW